MRVSKVVWSWNIKCQADKAHSEYLHIGGFRWLILILPQNGNKLSCFLLSGDHSDLPQVWSKLEFFNLALIDQTNGQKTVAEEYLHKYTVGPDQQWGCERFITLSKLPKNHDFFKTGTCTFHAEISVKCRDENVNQAGQVASKPAARVKNVEMGFDKKGWSIKCQADKLHSECLFIGGFPWLILILPKYANKLSCFLFSGDHSDLPLMWSKLEYFNLALIDQTNGQKTIAEEYHHKYIREPGWQWGCERFITLSELPNTHDFFKTGTCIFQAEISVKCRDENVNQAGQVASKPAARWVKNVANPLPKEFSVAASGGDGGELVDFKSFGKIEQAFVPLLEEVCSRHPSLLDCQRKRKRSPRFTEWAFTALGRVLHLLKNKKVKDMNEDACIHLGYLWEELETFKFDLTWLQPHVQSALSMKNYAEKVLQLKTLKENVTALDMEFKSVEEKLFSAKLYLEKAIQELSKEGFQERDLDSELGYGGP